MIANRIAVNGIHLGVTQIGKPNSTPLVLLHGFTSSAAGWGKHLDRFADAGLRVVALDMLGHGQSDAPADPARYGMAHCRDDILAALQQMDIVPEQAFLLGYSMGGRIALFTALAAPFLGVILESASPGIADAAERAARRASDAELADRIEREGIEAFVDYWTNIPLFASQRSIVASVPMWCRRGGSSGRQAIAKKIARRFSICHPRWRTVSCTCLWNPILRVSRPMHWRRASTSRSSPFWLFARKCCIGWTRSSPRGPRRVRG